MTSGIEDSPLKLAELIPARTDEGGKVYSGRDVIMALAVQPIASSEPLGNSLYGYDVGKHRLYITLGAWPASDIDIVKTYTLPGQERGPTISPGGETAPIPK